MARVLWRDAQGKEGTVILTRLEVRIGRAADCEICTEDGMVSRYHARIIRKGAGYVVEDLGSANGIFFDERQVNAHHLSHGDAVRCGSLWIRFVDGDGEGKRQDGTHAAPSPARGAHGTMVLPPPTATAAPTSAPPQSAGVGPAPAPATLPEQPRAEAAVSHGAPPLDDDAAQEIRLLRRRVEQLQLELRNVRGGKLGPEPAQRLQDVEAELFAVTADRDELRGQIVQLRAQVDARAKDEALQRAAWVTQTATEASQQLQDVLASLRVELIAASDEFDQYAAELPRASFELIRQALRDASGYAEQSRELVRTLAGLGDADEH